MAGPKRRTRPTALAFSACFLLCGLGILCALGVTTSAQDTTTQPEVSLPDAPGKDTFASVCSFCHSPTAVVGRQWTKPQWEAKVTEMLQEEPDVTAAERAQIVEYLSAVFRPGGRIYVNKAAAKDLETQLEIGAKEADALVKHRIDKGVFKTVDDLKQVPGVDAARIDAVRDRLEF